MKINAEYLEGYYNILKYDFQTGLDKITSNQFATIRKSEFESVVNKVVSRKYTFTRFKKLTLQKGREVNLPTIRDRIILEFLKNRLREKYNLTSPNRNTVIDSLTKRLQSEVDYFVVRLDIKNFFPSIPQNRLLQKLKANSLLSSQEYNLVKECLKQSTSGVPQGISISNVLSEIYLEGIDYQLKRLNPKISFYCRYVDDILILFNGTFNSSEISRLQTSISSIFNSYQLDSNLEKQKFINYKIDKTCEFEYLGYIFRNDNNKKTIMIEENKLDKFKNKIDFCIWDYKKNQNFDLLFERINYLLLKKVIIKRRRFLSRDSAVNVKAQKIYYGITESYKHVDPSYWLAIDKYLKQKITSISYLIPQRSQKRRLFSMSLKKNVDRNVILKIYKFDRSEYINRLIRINSQLLVSSLSNKSLTELSKLYFSYLKL